MKFLILFLLGVWSVRASSNAEDVANYLAQYGMQRFSGIRFMRAGGGQQCYEKYIPEVSAIAKRGKNETEACNNRAISRKQDELNKVEIQRAEISRQVKAVVDSLTKCSTNTDVIEFLRCLKTDASTNLDYVKQSAQDAAEVFNRINGTITAINLNENTCIGGVIAKAKKDTDNLFADLQRCLINGFDDPQPESSTESSSSEVPSEPNAESSTETSSEPTTESQPNDESNPELYPEADI